MNFSHLSNTDPAVAELIKQEAMRQRDGIELIASENYISPAVMEAMGTILNNKYSEGYPGKRYYAGNAVIDSVENLAIARTKELFGAAHVNVQPLSGSPANMAVYFALLSPGDKVMGFSLDQGGHLSHGHPLNFSGRLFNIVPYFVDRITERIDMDEVRTLALRERPKMIIAGFSAYSRDFDWPAFKQIADEIGAITFADIAHIAGLIAGGVLSNPVPYFDIVTTTTHKTLRGPRGALIMCQEKFAKEIDRAVFPGLQGGPHDHITAAKAVALKEAASPEFKTYAQQVIKNAQQLVQALQATGFRVISGGTDNHLILIDATSRGLSGKEAEQALDLAGLSCNKNMIPFDTRKPLDPSGIRLGTAALTTRGMKESDMLKIADWINRVFQNSTDSAKLTHLRQEVAEYVQQFPVPGIS